MPSEVVFPLPGGEELRPIPDGQRYGYPAEDCAQPNGGWLNADSIECAPDFPDGIYENANELSV